MSDECNCPTDISNSTILGVLLANVILSLSKPLIYKLMHNKLISNLVQYVDKQIEVEIPVQKKESITKV